MPDLWWPALGTRSRCYVSSAEFRIAYCVRVCVCVLKSNWFPSAAPERMQCLFSCVAHIKAINTHTLACQKGVCECTCVMAAWMWLPVRISKQFAKSRLSGRISLTCHNQDTNEAALPAGCCCFTSCSCCCNCNCCCCSCCCCSRTRTRQDNRQWTAAGQVNLLPAAHMSSLSVPPTSLYQCALNSASLYVSPPSSLSPSLTLPLSFQ